MVIELLSGLSFYYFVKLVPVPECSTPKVSVQRESVYYFVINWFPVHISEKKTL